MRSEPSTALKLLEHLLERYDGTASNNIRFRIVSNIAGCHLNLGNEEVAAKGFIEAFDLDPENPKAIANKALALLLNKDWCNLRAFAEDHLQEYSDNARLAAYYIHSLIIDEAISDPLDYVPDVVRNTPEVLMANVRWLMKRRNAGVWWEAAKAAHKVHPQDDELSELYACALLEQVVTESIFVYGRDLSEVDIENVQTAIGIYEPLWSRICDNSQNVRSDNIFIPINLMVAYRISNRVDEAVKTGNEALIRFPQNKELKICLAAALVEHGDSNRALDLISGLDGNHQIMTMRLEIAIANKDWTTISDLVSNHLDSFEKKRTFPAAVGVLAQVELAIEEDRRSILEAQHGKFDGDACALIVLAQCSRMHGFDDLAKNYFTAAIKAVERGDDGLDSRISVAQEAMTHKQYNTVVNVLYGFVPNDRISPALLLLTEAFVRIDPIRQRTIDFFEQLSPRIHGQHDFARLEGILHLNIGNHQNAIDLFLATLEQTNCIENLILLITAHLRAGNKKDVRMLLSNPDIDSLPGSSLGRLELCNHLVDFGKHERATKIAYNALLDDLDCDEVVVKYLKLISRILPYLSDTIHNKVATSLWVRFSSNQNKIYEVIVGEPANRLWGERADISNTFLSKALGKSINDKFEYTTAMGITENWTISEIKPRWLRAFDYFIGVFNQRYPESKEFSSFTVSKDDISTVCNPVRQHSEGKYARASPYLKFEAPMAFVAGNSIGGSIAFADYLVSIGESVHVTYGTESEQSEAHSSIDGNGRGGAVIDALTAWRAAELGIFPVLEEHLGPIVIPANEMAIIRSMVQCENHIHSKKERIFLRYHEGKYFRHSVTPEQHAKQLDVMMDMIEDIEDACRIKPVIIPDELPDSVEQILSSPIGNSFVCAILADEERKLLLCEDMIMRQRAMVLMGVKGVWLQAVLFDALQNETLTHHNYCDVLVQLALYRHFHIAVSVRDLLSVFERDECPNLTKLTTLCVVFGSKTADRDPHIEVVAEFINRIWSDDRYHGKQLTQPTDIVLNALLLNRSNERDSWAVLIYPRLNSAPKEYFAKWCRKHPLPDQSVM